MFLLWTKFYSWTPSHDVSYERACENPTSLCDFFHKNLASESIENH